jgi:ribonuclease J
VVENGTQVEFEDDKMTIGERVPGGYVFVDGSGVGDVGPMVMREREALARDGFVSVHLKLNGQDGKLASEPEIVSKGFVFIHEADELFEQARKRIEANLKDGTDAGLANKVERDLGKFFYAETGRRPTVVVFVSGTS